MASYKDEWRLMKEIHHTAVSFPQSLRDSFYLNPIQPLSANQIATIPTLILPFPDDIIAPVLTAQITDNSRQAILRQLTRAVTQMQDLYLKTYKEACLTSASLDMNTLRHACLALYKRHCSIIQSQVSSVLTEIVKVRPEAPDTKRSFNNEYTPFLEAYFEHNAYPPVRDRLALAQKSMMTPRQIEVWFQNHRNRAKKEGKALQRLSSSLPLQLSLEALEKRMPPLRISEINTMPGNPSDDSSADECPARASNSTIKPDHISNVEGFSNSSPPHAFPMRYPPNIASDPFRNENGIFKFPPPVWRRHPSTSQPQTMSLNMEEFTAMFAAKLNLREGVSQVQNKRKTHNLLTNPTPWFAARVTLLSPAPHPALLQSISPLSNTLESNLQNSSSRSRPVSPQTPCQKGSVPRKRAHLPRRTPSSVSFTTVSSLSSHQASSSRIPSLSSTSSRSTSSSSLSSVNPTTPLFSPTIQAQNALVIEEAELGPSNEFINSRFPYPFSNISLNSGCSRSTIAKQVLPSPLAISTAKFLVARS